MIIIPAIDIKGGRCVRLRQGVKTDETVYSNDPAAVAGRWRSLGASLIHVVDLDGAFGGEAANFDVISDVVCCVDIPVQIGGGIRDAKTAERYLALKRVKRVILGTAALKDPAFVRGLAREHPGRVAVGIDAKDGLVAVSGWVELSDTSAADLAKRLEDAGAACIVYTDISRDGMLSGPNVKATVDLARSVDVPVIASGGISSIEDVAAYKRASIDGGVALEGIIIGKALYDDKVDLRRAIEVASSSPS